MGRMIFGLMGAGGLEGLGGKVEEGQGGLSGIGKEIGTGLLGGVRKGRPLEVSTFDVRRLIFRPLRSITRDNSAL